MKTVSKRNMLSGNKNILQMKTVSIRNMLSGNIFKEINYINLNDDLYDKLENLISDHNTGDSLIQLFINDEILNNNDYSIDGNILDKLTDNDYISVTFNNKKIMYCLENVCGLYVLNCSHDKYSKLLNVIIHYCEYDSYDIIMNNSYKNLVLKAIEVEYGIPWFGRCESSLEFCNSELQNDKEVVLAAVKQFGYALQYASTNLQSDREVVLAAVTQTGYALQYASTNLKNDREVVLTAVTKEGFSLLFANINLRNDKEIVLVAVKQNRRALQHTDLILTKIELFNLD